MRHLDSDYGGRTATYGFDSHDTRTREKVEHTKTFHTLQNIEEGLARTRARRPGLGSIRRGDVAPPKQTAGNANRHITERRTSPMS